MSQRISSERRRAQRITVATSLVTLHRSYRTAVDHAVAHLGLSQSLAAPIAMIGRAGNGIRPGMLAELLAIEGPSLVRSIDQLVAAGLVERRDDADDRRAKTLHLTRAGEAARLKVEAALERLRDTLFANITDDDAAGCLRVFAELQRRLARSAPALDEAAVPAKTKRR